MKRLLLLFLAFAGFAAAATNTCTFTAADGTTLEAYAVGSELTWTENTAYTTGNVIISDANRGRTDTTNTSFLYVDNFTPANYNYDVECTVRVVTLPTSNSTYLGVGGRAASTIASGGYIAWLVKSASSWQIVLGLFGTSTLATVNITAPVAGSSYQLKLNMRDHIINCYWDGTKVISYNAGSGRITAVGNPTLFMDGATSFLSNSTGFHIDDYTVTDAPTPTTTNVTVTNSNLWYNGYDGTGTPQQSTFAAWKFTTAATLLNITGNTTLYTSVPGQCRLGLRVDGVDYAPYLSFTANGSKTFNCYLAEGTKTIEIITGGQSEPSGTILGSFIDSIQMIGNDFDPAYTLIPPSSEKKLLVYGDSISSGFESSVVERNGYVPRLRYLFSRNVHLEGHGFRTLNDDCATSGARTTFAARLASYDPKYIWLAIGTNDYGLNAWSAASFGTAYADLLDKLNAALPGVKIFCQTPLQRISPSAETANGSGNTLTDYRTQIATAVSTRTSYCTLVDGAAGAFIPDSSIHTDGLHVSTNGHIFYAEAIRRKVYGATIGSTGATIITGAGTTKIP